MWKRFKNVKSAKDKNLELPEDEKLSSPLVDAKQIPGAGSKPSVIKKIVSKLSISKDLQEMLELTLAVTLFALPAILIPLGFVGWGLASFVIAIIFIIILVDNVKR